MINIRQVSQFVNESRILSAKIGSRVSHYSSSVESDKASCFACCLFGSETGCSESNWCNEGVNRWDKMAGIGKDKPGKMSQHFSSASHRMLYKSFMLLK